MSRIYVIDDEAALGENIQRMLRSSATAVSTFTDPKIGLAECMANPPDLVLLDIRMPQMSGEEVFARLHEVHPGLPIVFLTAFGSVEGAVLAMRNGAFDYLQKPFKREDLLLVVKRALSHTSLKHEVETLKDRLEALGEADAAQSRSAAMLDQMEKCRRAAATDATVMILGESGTGKEVMARFIHQQSRRKDGPFVPVECSAMPGSLIESELFGYERGAFTGADRTKKGLIESADGGTLFLDEIGDLGVELQTRLFRFVEERVLRRLGGLTPVRVECRILCATNQDLLAKIKAGTFREELYYRLSVVTVKIPPLRERPEDIQHLARFFLERFSRRYGKSLSASPGFYEALLRERWPGNVRQLKNVMERLTALHPGGVLGPEDLEEDTPKVEAVSSLSSLPWKDAREQYLSSFETSYAHAVLTRCGGNVSAAAREAGVDRKTFYALLNREKDQQVGESAPQHEAENGE
ncbi:MAG TPA: sigma-54 dependent transcriptional regulator [Edaphobacter sp.]|uniref:sigma-54-dependent transcriptional regulator n=1 Tax=Edaphobacter sp. TaxID=1934404 RepID=UPI002CB525FB|nr:sigma-54 dependent transcriptional regulator [Edaphobacter sp.]HUZ97169.1 sigma-54 dependent transcriptional regulator [Edaphobacter sp.]